MIFILSTMTSVYEGLICELKIKMKTKNIKFNKVFSLINNEKYDKIIAPNAPVAAASAGVAIPAK